MQDQGAEISIFFLWTTLEEEHSRESCASQHRLMMLYLGCSTASARETTGKHLMSTRIEVLLCTQSSGDDNGKVKGIDGANKKQKRCHQITEVVFPETGSSSILCSSKVHGAEQPSPELPLLRINCHSYFDLLFYTRTF